MLATVLLATAAALPFGVWPQDTGPAATMAGDVEIYVLEPEDDYSILAVQTIVPSLNRSDAAAMSRVVDLAGRLGADAVILLGEMPEAAIPKDLDQPLPTTNRYAAAAYVVFATSDAHNPSGAVPARRVAARRGARRHLRSPARSPGDGTSGALTLRQLTPAHAVATPASERSRQSPVLVPDASAASSSRSRISPR
jgi:hypothetical protein